MIQFDNSKPIFNPHSLSFEKNYQSALMIFDDEIWEDYILKHKLATLEVKNSHGRIFNTFRDFTYHDQDILLIYHNTGGAAAAIDLELLIASGIQKIVAFGTCGIFQEGIAKNTIIFPTAAIREEGVSYHYLPDNEEVIQDKAFIKTAENLANNLHLPYIEGKIWTTDAVYRETINKIKLMHQLGCIGVDMELASLLAVAKFRKIQFSQFLIADDILTNIPDSSSSVTPPPLPRHSQTILELALNWLKITPPPPKSYNIIQ